MPRQDSKLRSLAARFYEEGAVPPELRVREQATGVTLDARRALRIRDTEARPSLSVVPRQPDNLALAKVRAGKPLTAADLDSLEELLARSGACGPEDIQRAVENAKGLGTVHPLAGGSRPTRRQWEVRRIP